MFHNSFLFGPLGLKRFGETPLLTSNKANRHSRFVGSSMQRMPRADPSENAGFLSVSSEEEGVST